MSSVYPNRLGSSTARAELKLDHAFLVLLCRQKMTESLGCVHPTVKVQYTVYVTVKPIPVSSREEVTSGPLIRRPLVHVLDAETVREPLVSFLERETDLWNRALNPNLPFAELEEAWIQVLKDVRPLIHFTLGKVVPEKPLHTLDGESRGPSEVVITPRVFRRIYKDSVLKEPCDVGCVNFPTDSCGDVINGVFDRRFQDSIGIEDKAYGNSTWQHLRGVHLRAFVLLVMVHTGLFVADIAGSRLGQRKISTFLATCQNRFFHIVNYGKDDLLLNAQEVDTV